MNTSVKKAKNKLLTKTKTVQDPKLNLSNKQNTNRGNLGDLVLDNRTGTADSSITNRVQ